MKNYVIHNAHGPTVFQFDRLLDALDWLFQQAKRNTNGGTYILRDKRGKEYARIDTWAMYEPLNWEHNHPLVGA